MNNDFDFSTIIASSVHDLKNSISLLLGSVDELTEGQVNADGAIEKTVSQLRYEALRVNNNLIQLLGIYKLGNRQYQLNTDYHCVQEVLYEYLLQYQSLFESKALDVELDCEDSLFWFFDRNLISGVLNDVINNAVRYAQKELLVKAVEVNGSLEISIQDDGPGFPQKLLGSYAEGKSGLDFHSGSTGLGLYFASLVAQQHKKNGKVGSIQLINGATLSGGCFSIIIP